MIATGARAASPLDRLFAVVKRAGYGFHLLLERRVWLYLAGDAYFLFAGLLTAIDSMGSEELLNQIYPRIVVAPMLVLGLPAMSGVVALERRAGSLDLALAVPSTESYFRRRIAPVCAFLTLQGWIVLGDPEPWPCRLATLRSLKSNWMVGPCQARPSALTSHSASTSQCRHTAVGPNQSPSTWTCTHARN